MNPHWVPDHPFWQFSVEAPCSRPPSDPALAFSLHSDETGDEQHEQTMHFSHLKLTNSNQILLLPPFCPTADEDIAAGCLSSL